MLNKEFSQRIFCVQGDNLYTIFRIDPIVSLDVDKVVFTCAQLDLNIELMPIVFEDSSEDSAEDSDESTTIYWLLDGPSTKEFRVGVFDYDLTVISSPLLASTKTYVYNGKLTIAPRMPGKEKYRAYWEYPHNLKKDH